MLKITKQEIDYFISKGVYNFNKKLYNSMFK